MWSVINHTRTRFLPGLLLVISTFLILYQLRTIRSKYSSFPCEIRISWKIQVLFNFHRISSEIRTIRKSISFHIKTSTPTTPAANLRPATAIIEAFSEWMNSHHFSCLIFIKIGLGCIDRMGNSSWALQPFGASFMSMCRWLLTTPWLRAFFFTTKSEIGISTNNSKSQSCLTADMLLLLKTLFPRKVVSFITKDCPRCSCSFHSEGNEWHSLTHLQSHFIQE